MFKEILEPLMTPQVTMVLRLLMFSLAIIYVASIVWVYRDSSVRSTRPYLWMLLGFVPLVGPIVYTFVRPPLFLDEAQENALEIARRERELAEKGYCPSCRYPTEPDFLVCPNCGHGLKNPCRSCAQPLRPEWRICPYCRARAGE